jgi:hypothetical protein
VAYLDETLSERVGQLARAPMRSTTGTRAAIEALAARTAALEDVVRELAARVHDLAEAQRGADDESLT